MNESKKILDSGNMMLVSMETEKASNDFLELASEQRLSILEKLSEKRLNNSKLAEVLGATKPEIHRNVTRLTKAGLIKKNTDGNYELTVYGSAILLQIPSLTFFADNNKFFSNHTLGNLETKFIQRIGSLQNRKQVKGFVKVLEKWRQIHENADKYIHNILSEVPYSGDIIEVISKQLENNLKICSVFSDKAILPEERKKIFEKKGFSKYVKNGNLERRIKKGITVVVLVTDKEAAVFFPNEEGVPDLSIMFYSSDKDFREWCQDYFNWCWDDAASFQESRIHE